MPVSAIHQIALLPADPRQNSAFFSAFNKLSHGVVCRIARKGTIKANVDGSYLVIIDKLQQRIAKGSIDEYDGYTIDLTGDSNGTCVLFVQGMGRDSDLYYYRHGDDSPAWGTTVWWTGNDNLAFVKGSIQYDHWWINLKDDRIIVFGGTGGARFVSMLSRSNGKATVQFSTNCWNWYDLKLRQGGN